MGVCRAFPSLRLRSSRSPPSSNASSVPFIKGLLPAGDGTGAVSTLMSNSGDAELVFPATSVARAVK
jgi:hypothetical protein